MYNNEYQTELIHEVKSRLVNYLQLNGREVTRNGTFQCLMPERHNNGDQHYSASITKQHDGTYLWYCHACVLGGTIFDLAHLVEGLPIHGYGFIQTVQELASRLGIAIEYDKLPEMSGKKAIDIYSLEELYREIETYIHSYGNGVEHLMNGEFGRSYTKEHAEAACRLVPLGCVNAPDLTTHMISRFGLESVEKLPFYEPDTKLLAPYLFNHNRLVIAIRDRIGRPVSFSGRAKDALCDKALLKSQVISKYISARGFDGIKKDTFFLFSEAKQAITENHAVYIVEGQFDTLAMHSAGIPNCVGILGSSFTTATLDKLVPYKVYSIIMVTDPDKAGIRAVRKALEAVRYYDVVLLAIELPEGKDPDTLLRNGDTSFLDTRVDAITLVLTKDPEFHAEKMPPEIRYKKMIEFVVKNCQQEVKYREYAKVVSKQTGYYEEDILRNLQNYMNGGVLISKEEKKITKNIFNACSLPIVEKVISIENNLPLLKNLISKSSSVERTTWHDFLSLIHGDQPFPTTLKTGFPRFDAAFNLECSSLVLISGWPSNAKSSWLRYITIHMLRQYPDLYCLYVSTDDHVIKPLSSFLGILTGIEKKTIRKHIEEKMFMNRQEVSQALDEIHRLFHTQLLLRGVDSCASIAPIRQKMEYIRSFHKGHLVLVIDAMNDLDDMGGENDRIATENALRIFKNMAVTYDAIIFLVIHLTKNNGREGQRPRLGNLKGTSFLEYAGQNVFLAHMDMHYKVETQLSWYEPGSFTGERFPVVEISGVKDKENQAGIVMPFHFNPLTGAFYEPQEQLYSHYVDIIQQEVCAYGQQNNYSQRYEDML